MVIGCIGFRMGIGKIGCGLGTILGGAELAVRRIMWVLVLKEGVVCSEWLGV
ncbi:hypothetical protein [Bacillus thuringiensis]|uniref:hypothetical protein n=1 Tax=Bacillus thuringiensis TaxID=1428 RepID=UPI0016433294